MVLCPLLPPGGTGMESQLRWCLQPLPGRRPALSSFCGSTQDCSEDINDEAHLHVLLHPAVWCSWTGGLHPPAGSRGDCSSANTRLVFLVPCPVYPQEESCTKDNSSWVETGASIRRDPRKSICILEMFALPMEGNSYQIQKKSLERSRWVDLLPLNSIPVPEAELVASFGTSVDK